jgi:zinc transport system substrate-binding protein
MRIHQLVALLAVTVTAGCGTGVAASPAADPRPRVVTAFYPLRFLARTIGGDAVTVTDLTKPGAEPHDVELSPRQVGQVSDAALVVYLHGFQPAIDQAVAMEAAKRAFDAGSVVEQLPLEDDGHEHEEATASGHDPHLWLDPVRYATIAGELGRRLALADPAHAAGYTERADRVRAELGRLDQEYRSGLATCARRAIVTSHTAFHYLADRYALTEIGITGIDPESEPSPARLVRAAEQARATGTTTIFFETLVSPKVAETLAREIGARSAVLDPLEGLTQPGSDYFSVMRANLAALTLALGCSA